MLKKYSIWFFVVAVVLLPLTVFAIVSWYEITWQNLPVYNAKENTIADFNMVNQKGNAISLRDWKNKIVVVDFFFTHCTTVCPKMTNNLKEIQKIYGTADVLINSFTVDPERDSVQRLKFYADQFGIKDDNWNLLTGAKKEIYRLARKSFFIVAADGDGGPNDFIHSAKLVLIDQQKQIRGYYDGTSEEEIKQLISDIKKLKNEN